MIKALEKFDSISAFNRYTDFLIESKWRIEKQLLKERILRHCEVDMFKKLKESFDKQKLSIWPLKDEEVITWLDTMLLLRRVLNNIENQIPNINDLHIIVEYPLIYGNHMRTDYLIVYSRLIIVLEFGMFNQDEKRSEERYTKKLQESNSYRQILANIIDPSLEVVNYVMIYRPEYDWYHDENMKENTKYNYGEMDKLCRFIIRKINQQNNLLAYNQLVYNKKER